jgi:hypothetical protein
VEIAIDDLPRGEFEHMFGIGAREYIHIQHGVVA